MRRDRGLLGFREVVIIMEYGQFRGLQKGIRTGSAQSAASVLSTGAEARFIHPKVVSGRECLCPRLHFQ
jgi:hypothetical protein